MYPKILVLDETLNNIPEMQSALQPIEAEFFKAHTSQEAQDLVNAHSFDVLLLSSELFNPEELISNAPMIFLSQNKAKFDAISKYSNKNRIIDNIEKPINMELLMNKLKLFLEILFQKELLKKELENKKQAEFLAKRYAEILESKVKELRLFASVAASNLEEPLKTIESNLKKLEQNATKSCIAETLDATLRMRTLMKAYLRYASIDVENGNQLKTPISLNTVLEDALQEMKGALETNQVNLKINQEAIKACQEIKGNKEQLSLVLQSILANAIKFKSEKPLEIRIEAEKLHGLSIVSISDNGRGMDPKYYEQIFWVLKPEDEKMSAGVSLAICKKIIEQIGGKIWVHSALNEGSTFYLALPAAN